MKRRDFISGTIASGLTLVTVGTSVSDLGWIGQLKPGHYFGYANHADDLIDFIIDLKVHTLEFTKDSYNTFINKLRQSEGNRKYLVEFKKDDTFDLSVPELRLSVGNVVRIGINYHKDYDYNDLGSTRVLMISDPNMHPSVLFSWS